MQRSRYLIYILLLFSTLACSQRHRAEVCNFSDVLTCSLSSTNLDDIQSCVATTTGSACELSEDVMDQINASNSDEQPSYTCSELAGMKDLVESKGFSLTHFTDTTKNTIYVDTFTTAGILSTPTQYTVTRTIQDAINSATKDSLIVVCPGHYYENLVIQDSSKDGIEIKNIADGNSGLTELTAIQSLGVDSVMKISNALRIKLTGLTLQNGMNDYGGGLQIAVYRDDAVEGDSITIKNSVIQDCNALVAGGGVSIEGTEPVEFDTVTIQRNSATYGGGMIIKGTDSTSQTVALSNTNFDKNTALTLAPALYAEANTLVVMSAGLITTQAGEVSGTDFPAVHLAGTAQFSATETDWGSSTSENSGGDIFDEAQLNHVLAEFNLSTDTLDWANWQSTFDSWVAEFQDTADTLKEQPWLYDFHGIDTVVCNQDSENPSCTSATNTPTVIDDGGTGNTDGDDTDNDGSDPENTGDSGEDDSNDGDAQSFDEWLADIASGLATWTESFASSFAITESIPADSNETDTTIHKNLDGVRAQINGLNVFSDKIFPALIATQAMNSISLGDSITIKSGTQDVVGCNYTWSLKAHSIVITPEFTTSDLQLSFRDANSIASSFVSHEATLTAKMKFRASAPSILCPDLDADFSVKSSDLSSSMNLALQLDSANSIMSVSDISGFEYSFDNQSVQNVSWWEGLKIGIFLDTNSKDVGNIGGDTFSETLRDTINQTLAYSLAFSGEMTNPVKLTYNGTPTDFTTSQATNSLLSSWQIDVSSTDDPHSCATGVSPQDDEPSLSAPLSVQDDFALEISNASIEKMLVVITKIGLFCSEFQIDTPVTPLDLLLTPHGKISVSKNTDRTSGQLTIKIPFNGKLTTVEASENSTSAASATTKFSATPLQINSISLTGNAQNSFTYDLVLNVSLNVNCDSGLVAKVNDVQIANLSGSVSLAGFDFDVSGLQTVLSTIAASFIDQLSSEIPLAPKILNLDGLNGFATELDEVNATDTGLSFGVNLVSDEYCGTENN